MTDSFCINQTQRLQTSSDIFKVSEDIFNAGGNVIHHIYALCHVQLLHFINAHLKLY